MAVLETLLKFKEMERQKANADINAIGTAVNTFIQAKQGREDRQLNNLLAQAQIKNINSQIEERGKDSPLNDLLRRGKAVDAAISVGDMDLANKLRGVKSVDQFLEPTIANVTPKIPLQVDLGVEQSSKEPKVGDFIPSKLDRFGNPEGFERVKKTAAQEKREVEIGELDNQINSLVDSFRAAREEASNVSGIGKRGVTGRIAGQKAIISGKFGHSPAVNTFQSRIKAFATTVAKAAGEVRPTDKDIERFIETLPSVAKNDEENEILINALVNDLKDRGAKAVWSDRGVKGSSKFKVGQKVSKAGRNFLIVGFDTDGEPLVEELK